MWAASQSPKPKPVKKKVVKVTRLICAAPDGFEGAEVYGSIGTSSHALPRRSLRPLWLQIILERSVYIFHHDLRRPASLELSS